MQNWTDLYTELSEKITTELPNVEWVDLWHNQVNFLEEEHPFPTPAIFMSFRTLSVSDSGIKTQHMTLQVDFYLFYETFADTYQGSANQESALAFLEIMNGVYKNFHGTEGENYSNMRCIAVNPVDTGNAGNLYQLSFECLLVDYKAVKEFEDVTLGNITISDAKFEVPREDFGNGFIIRD